MQLSYSQLYNRSMHSIQRLQTLAKRQQMPVLEYVQTHPDQVDAVIHRCFKTSTESHVLPVCGPFFCMPGGTHVCSLCLGDKYTASEQQGARLLQLNQSVCDVHYTLPSRLDYMHQQLLSDRRVKQKK